MNHHIVKLLEILETNYNLNITMEVFDLNDQSGYGESYPVETKSFPDLPSLIQFMQSWGELITATKVFHPEYPDIYYHTPESDEGKVVTLFPFGMDIIEKKKIFDVIRSKK